MDWQAIVRGDEHKFECLVREMTPALSRLCYRMLSWDPDAMEDVIQDVWVRVWVRRSSFQGKSSLETWVMSIALNVCRTRIRKQRLWRRFMGLVQPRAIALTEPGPPDEWPRVVQAMRVLPAKLNEVLVLHYLEEEPVERVAAMLGVRKNTIEVRLYRARKRLHQLLKEELGESENANVAIRRTVTVV